MLDDTQVNNGIGGPKSRYATDDTIRNGLNLNHEPDTCYSLEILFQIEALDPQIRNQIIQNHLVKKYSKLLL